MTPRRRYFPLGPAKGDSRSVLTTLILKEVPCQHPVLNEALSPLGNTSVSCDSISAEYFLRGRRRGSMAVIGDCFCAIGLILRMTKRGSRPEGRILRSQPKVDSPVPLACSLLNEPHTTSCYRESGVFPAEHNERPLGRVRVVLAWCP